MPRNLGDVAAGINESFFGGLIKERQDEKTAKDQEQARRLAGLHLLLQDPNTTEAAIPDILEQIAKDSGIHKEPLVQHTLQSMRAGMQRQVPYGQEEKRTVVQHQLGTEAPRSVSQGVQVPQRQLMMVPPEPTRTGVATVAAQPDAGTSDLLGLDRQKATLSAVPREEMYQPTKAYGELTQAEAEDLRKSQSFISQQKAMLDRQSQLAEELGDRQAVRDIQRQKDQLEQIEKKAEESRKTQSALFENKIKMLEPEMQVKARLRVTQIAASLDPKIPYEDRLQQARDMAHAEIEVGLEQKKQQIAQSKAAVEHWKRQDANQLLAINKRGEGVGGATLGMSASEARYMNAQLLEVKPTLNRAQAELNRLYRIKAATNAGLQPGSPNYDTSYDAQIAAQEKERDDALEKIRSVRQEVLDRRQTTTPTVPPQPGSQRSAKPASDPLGLFK